MVTPQCNDYTETVKKLLQVNMAAKSTDSLLVVTDTEKEEIGHTFVQAGRELGLESVHMSMSPRQKSGEEPPYVVSEAMRAADIVLCITEHSLTHTNARRQAVAAGARLATMPGLTPDMLSEGAITANYDDVQSFTERVSVSLDQGSQVVIEKAGQTLSFSIAHRSAISSTGVFKEKGQSGNLPSGESYIAPVEGTAEGTITIDQSIAGLGIVNEPVTLEIANGRLIEASGQKGKELLNLLGDGDGRMVCEFGIGTNKSARVTGNVLEDEKVYGTVHIAFGSNRTFGGKIDADVHIDCVVSEPKVWIDGVLVMDGGEWVGK